MVERVRKHLLGDPQVGGDRLLGVAAAGGEPVAPRGEPDSPSGIGIFGGIIEEVRNDLLQPHRIGFEHERLRWQRDREIMVGVLDPMQNYLSLLSVPRDTRIDQGAVDTRRRISIGGDPQDAVGHDMCRGTDRDRP